MRVTALLLLLIIIIITINKKIIKLLLLLSAFLNQPVLQIRLGSQVRTFWFAASFFTGWASFPTLNQQRQSTEESI